MAGVLGCQYQMNPKPLLRHWQPHNVIKTEYTVGLAYQEGGSSGEHPLAGLGRHAALSASIRKFGGVCLFWECVHTE